MPTAKNAISKVNEGSRYFETETVHSREKKNSIDSEAAILMLHYKPKKRTIADRSGII